MKFTTRFILIIVLLFAFAMPLSSQGRGANEVAGAYFIDAPDGGKTSETDDDVYEIILEGVDAEVDWYLATPVPYVGTADGALLFQAWGTVEDLSTTAFIELEDMIIEFEMSNPAYDSTVGDLTFIASIVALDPKDPENTKLSVPKSFDEAKLTFTFDNEFDAVLAEAMDEVMEGTRTNRSGSNSRPRPPRRP